MRPLAALTLVGLAVSLAPAPPAHAQSQRIRLQGIWVNPSGSFDQQGLRIDPDAAFGSRVAWEHVWNGRYGLELAAATSVHGSSSSFEEEPTPVGDTRITPLSAAFNLHFSGSGHGDFFVGAGLAYVGYSDVEVAFAGQPNESLAIDDDLTWLIQLGFDLPLRGSLGLSFGAQYLDTDAVLQVLGGTAEISVAPWVVATGLVFHF